MNGGAQLAPLRGAPGIVRLHGHRAARGVLPENTLIGFRNTFDIGVQAVELDVLVTADEVPVVTHNPRLMAASTRGPDGAWLTEDSALIAQMTFAELQQYDIGGLRAGTEYADRYPDQAFMTGLRVPSLAQVAEMITGPGLDDAWLNIEIKSHPDKPEQTPPLPVLAGSVLEVISAYGIRDRVLLQSFDWRVLGEIERQAPDLPRSYLSYAPRPDPPMEVNIFEGSAWMGGASLARHGGSLPKIVAALGGTVWSPHFRDCTAMAVAEAHALGLVVNVWTVNERADVRRMIDIGVDGIITDYPARVQRCLLSQGLTWREDITPFMTAS